MKAAAYCATRNLYHDLIPSVKSLLLHSDVGKIYLLIEDDNFPEYLPPECECINVSQQKYFIPGGPNWNRKWTWMVLMRCARSKILPPDLDRVLSLDADTIVEMDISDLWDLDLTGWYLAAAGERDEAERLMQALETMEGQDWSWALTLGDLYTRRQDYDKAVAWYRRAQEMQPSPKFIDAANSIAHICEIRGDKAGAIAAYREQLRLLAEDWGIVSGEEREQVERAIRKLQ